MNEKIIIQTKFDIEEIEHFLFVQQIFTYTKNVYLQQIFKIRRYIVQYVII